MAFVYNAIGAIIYIIISILSINSQYLIIWLMLAGIHTIFAVTSLIVDELNSIKHSIIELDKTLNCIYNWFIHIK